MALAAKDLALTRGQNSAARPTRGAALSARALALIYAASPLANGNNDEFAQLLVDDKGNRLLSPEYSEEKWAKAAAAAKDVMDLGVYELYTADRRTTDSPAEPATINGIFGFARRRLSHSRDFVWAAVAFIAHLVADYGRRYWQSGTRLTPGSANSKN